MRIQDGRALLEAEGVVVGQAQSPRARVAPRLLHVASGPSQFGRDPRVGGARFTAVVVVLGGRRWRRRTAGAGIGAAHLDNLSSDAILSRRGDSVPGWAAMACKLVSSIVCIVSCVVDVVEIAKILDQIIATRLNLPTYIGVNSNAFAPKLFIPIICQGVSVLRPCCSFLAIHKN
jgi:hypothetical protein